ncbi:MAG TPA: CrpP-related protein [Pseudorhizobium sp.]|nr:CrpP-related protein [Pseudorhizobium sp.]
MKARSRGLGYQANPFLVKEQMPQATGEPVAEWRQKAEAWLFGWLLENAWSGEAI